MNRMIGHEYRTTTVYIDSYTDNIPRGALSNPYFGGAERSFVGVIDFLCQIDGMLTDMQFPQPFEHLRSFADAPVTAALQRQITEQRRGKLATFTLRIFYRQNASWQGTLLWNETGQEESFRSVLELLMLMHSALTA